MRAFVTGISGFVGAHLSEFLLSKNLEVSGIGTSENPGISKEARYQSVDILDSEKLKKIISETRPELIFHLAGISSVKKSYDQPELCKKINVAGTKNLLDAVIEAKINPKILVVGSAEVYGAPGSVPVKETADLNPRNPYAESKKEQEDLCRKYMEKLKIIISRSFQHTGPGQKPLFATSDFAKQIAEIEKGLKEPVIKVGNLEARRSFTDVRDMVKAYYLSLQKCTPSETYNICSGKVYSIREALDMLLSMSKVKIEVKIDPKKIRPNDIPVQVGNSTKFQSQTGWQPEIPFEKTLKDLLDFWREKVK